MATEREFFFWFNRKSPLKDSVRDPKERAEGIKRCVIRKQQAEVRTSLCSACPLRHHIAMPASILEIGLLVIMFSCVVCFVHCLVITCTIISRYGKTLLWLKLPHRFYFEPWQNKDFVSLSFISR